jgi:predicted nuclease of predicted toxin-antitoxin system
MKLLLDMNLSPRLAELLQAKGFEAVHLSEVGPANSPDRDVLDWAAERGFVVVTADLDFPAILAATKSGRPSVIVIRNENLAPEASVGPLTGAISAAKDQLEAGAVVSLDASRSRIRLLPLGS